MTTATDQHIKIQVFDAKIVGDKTYQVRCHTFPGRMAHKLTAEIIDADGTILREQHFQLGTRLISNSEQLRKAKRTIDDWASR